MFKPELWQSHDEYRTIVNLYGHRLSRGSATLPQKPMATAALLVYLRAGTRGARPSVGTDSPDCR